MVTECRCKVLRQPKSKKAFAEALSLLLQQIDFEKLTISDIIEKSGYSRGTFYRYYNDKHDFLQKVLAHEANIYAVIIHHILRSSSTDEKQSYLKEYLSYVHKNRTLYHAILNDLIPSCTQHQFIKLAMDYCKLYIELPAKQNKKEINQDFCYFAIAYTLFGWVAFWDHNDYSYTPAYISKQLTNLTMPDSSFLQSFSFSCIPR